MGDLGKLTTLRWYGFAGTFRLILSFLFTKLFYSKARLIRLPVYIRSNFKIRFPAGFTCGPGFRLDIFDGGMLSIGDNVRLNDYVHIGVCSNVKIGSDTLIASRVTIIDHNHGNYSLNGGSNPTFPPRLRELSSKPIHIGACVWIGEGAIILPGTSIGNGTIIGAGAVVTNSLPSYCIAVGNPARPIRIYDFESLQWVKFDASH